MSSSGSDGSDGSDGQSAVVVVGQEHDMAFLSAPFAAVTSAVLAGALSTATQDAYRFELLSFFGWLCGVHFQCDASRLDIRHITRDTLTGYQGFLASRVSTRELSPSSANRRMSVVRRFIHEAYMRDLLPKDYAAGLKGFKVRGDSPYLTLDAYQVRRMLESIPSDHLLHHQRARAMLALMLGAGLRAQEVCQVRWADFATSGGHLVLWVNGKGNKRATVKLRPDVYRVCASYAARTSRDDARVSDKPLFTSLRHQRVAQEYLDIAQDAGAISRQSVWTIVARAAARAGITQKVTPHCLRATFATLAYAGGATVDEIRVALRHESAQTTMRYIRALEKLTSSAADKLKGVVFE